ncbi:MAG: glycoside hydrolase family 2 TIM barrel-domain containing protein [Marinoscillum sp.]|uniref:sugar-binding domain-containing protein n=1 Tax=Marinoscillum sp. TaxID=2024838 RepID=UPI003301AE5A
MDKLLHIGLLLFYLLFTTTGFSQKLDLSGTWQVRVDSMDLGLKDRWFEQTFDGYEISLPGSLTENGYGRDVTVSTPWTGEILDSSWYNAPRYTEYRQPGNIKIPFWLQPMKHYLGAAWYQREITLPETTNEQIRLFLERPHWQTTVWIDGVSVGSQNSLATPHEFYLPPVTDGKHVITIRIDNRLDTTDVGNSAHSVSDNTQTNWNGLVGSLYLEFLPDYHIQQIGVYPIPNSDDLTIALKTSGAAPSGMVLFDVFDPSGERVISTQFPAGDSAYHVKLPVPLFHWDEFTPHLYTLRAELQSGGEVHNKEVRFGLRTIDTEGRQITLNNRPIFLRGTLDCAIFPKTGYPPTHVEAWKSIFETVKSYGLNHVRYHSWCPPEAAFDAADEMGVYLQVEASAWANTITSKIGDGNPIDAYIYDETRDILDTYGHHPSLCLIAYGNEPGGKNQKDYLTEYVRYFQEYDPTRIYTGGAGWPFVPNADFYLHAGPRLQHWGAGLSSSINSLPPQTMDDYDELIESIEMPYISHEMGQWCVYPDFEEISEYTGVLKANNFEIFQEELRRKGLGHLATSYLDASGQLQVLCYKADMEKSMRTREMAGFQLLGLQDFSGQGTAPIGVVNAFWQPKGYVTSDEFKSFCDTTVLLARLPKRTYTTDEVLEATLEISHYGQENLKGNVHWSILAADVVLDAGSFLITPFNRKSAVEQGSITLDLSSIQEPQILTLKAKMGEISNEWDFWVYPEVEISDEIYHSNWLDKKARKVLRKGGGVLYSLPKNSLGKQAGGDIGVGFSSIFWNTAYTSGQKPHTLGILANPDHPALREFPTSYHSDWQWWDLMSRASAIDLDKVSPDLKPIVRIIDDWFENRDLGLLFEVQVGKGKLLVSSVDLKNLGSDQLPSRQMLKSLIAYMASDAFQPEVKVNLMTIENLTNE